MARKPRTPRTAANKPVEIDPMEDDTRDDVPEQVSDPEPQQEAEQQEPFRFFFIAAVRVLWVRDGKGKERTVNVLLNLAVPYVNQGTLNDISRAACGRVMKENKVDAKDVREAITLNISILGQMTETMFKEDPIPSAVTDDAFNDAQLDVAKADSKTIN